MESNEPAASPERRLLVAIITQSVDDLTHHNSLIRGEARAFWTARFGPLADRRRELLALLDIDDTVARARIAHLLTDDHVREQRVRMASGRPIYMDLLRLIPDGEHTIAAIKALDPNLSENSAHAAVQALKEKGLIRRTTTMPGGALWGRTDWIMASVA